MRSSRNKIKWWSVWRRWGRIIKQWSNIYFLHFSAITNIKEDITTHRILIFKVYLISHICTLSNEKWIIFNDLPRIKVSYQDTDMLKSLNGLLIQILLSTNIQNPLILMYLECQMIDLKAVQVITKVTLLLTFIT